MKPLGKTIQIFLPEGDPRGVKIAEVTSRNISAILSRSTIYRRMEEGEFPKSFGLGGGAVAWLESDVLEWMEGILTSR